MNLTCTICQAVQPVTCHDEADEDARTLAIRRAFRAFHMEHCGERSVQFRADVQVADEPDVPALWMTAHPEHVTLGGDGFFSAELYRDGVKQSVRVCEDCWKPIPRHIDFPFGLVSPESDGDKQGNGAKLRPGQIEGKRAVEHLRKAVCLPCYVAAYQRYYPGQTLPKLSADVIGDGTPVAAPVEVEDDLFIHEPGKEATL